MKHFLALALAPLLLAASTVAARADSPATISADYRRQGAAALEKVNDMLEKATVPLVAALVKSGDTQGANELREQLKAKTNGVPVKKPQGSATALFKSYDSARAKALEPVQAAAVKRIETMLAGSEGKKSDVVTELGRVRTEIETGTLFDSSSIPSSWTYHRSAEGEPLAYLTVKPDGTWSLIDVVTKATTEGTWKQTGDNTADLETGGSIWKFESKGRTGLIVRSSLGTRYLKQLRK